MQYQVETPKCGEERELEIATDRSEIKLMLDETERRSDPWLLTSSLQKALDIVSSDLPPSEDR